MRGSQLPKARSLSVDLHFTFRLRYTRTNHAARFDAIANAPRQISFAVEIPALLCCRRRQSQHLSGSTQVFLHAAALDATKRATHDGDYLLLLTAPRRY